MEILRPPLRENTGTKTFISHHLVKTASQTSAATCIWVHRLDRFPVECRLARQYNLREGETNPGVSGKRGEWAMLEGWRNCNSVCGEAPADNANPDKVHLSIYLC